MSFSGSFWGWEEEEDEDIITAPWTGSTSSKNILSVVVLSTNTKIIDRISTALTEVHAKGSYKWKLVLHRGANLETVAQLTKITGNVSLDFIVLAMDTSRSFCIEWASTILTQIHPDLRRGRVILVNTLGSAVNSFSVDASEVLLFQEDHKLDLLSADITNVDDSMHLARRLFRYLEVVIGVQTGIPNFNV